MRSTEEYQTAKSEIEYLMKVERIGGGPAAMRIYCDLRLDWVLEDREYMVIPAESGAPLCELARSDREVFELAVFAAGTQLRAGRKVEPPVLAEFVGFWMTGGFKPPPKKRGAKSSTKWKRDFIIRETARRLKLQYSLPLTADPGNPSGAEIASAASIIHNAMHDLGVNPPSVRRVENIITKSAGEEDDFLTKHVLIAPMFEVIEEGDEKSGA